MKGNFKKSTIRSLFLVAGVSFFLSGCSLKRDNNVDTLKFRQELESYSDELYEKYKDKFDEIYNDYNSIESVYDNSQDTIDDNKQDRVNDKKDNVSDKKDNASYKKDSNDDKKDRVDDTNKKDKEELEYVKLKKEIEINDVSEFNKYFKDKVSFKDLRKVIKKNSNLSSKDKKFILKLVDKLEEKAPYIDLRCLYENAKLLSIERCANPDSDSQAVAEFSPYEHKIYLYGDDESDLAHEVIHMIMLLFLEIKDKDICLFRTFGSGDTNFLTEGFTEWFTKYLFDYDEYTYHEQVHDIDIIKYILGSSNKKFIKRFTDGNTSYVTKSLKKYLTKNELKDWISISEKELEAGQYKSRKNITSSEAIKKYTILLKSCMKSREVIGSSEMYQIMDLLVNTLLCDYNNREGMNLQAIMDGVKDTLMNNLDYTNNGIEILSNDYHSMKYCDIDQLYLIQYANGNYTIAEQYMDSNGKEKYYANIPFNLSEGDVTVPVTELIEYADLGSESYFVSQLIEIYEEYKGKYNQTSDAYQNSQNGK